MVALNSRMQHERNHDDAWLAERGLKRLDIIANAQSYKERVVSEVVADKVYFTKLLQEYKKNPKSVLVSLYSTTLADALAQSKDKYAIGINPGLRQEVRLKLNPEPVIKKNADNAKEVK